MKKVNVFKMTFPDNVTHYGVSEQVNNNPAYLSKMISIANSAKKRSGNVNGVHMTSFLNKVLEFTTDITVEIVFTSDNRDDCKIKRDELVKVDKMSMNNHSNVNARVNSSSEEIKLPLEKSKSMTSKDGNKIYFVELGYARLKGLLEKVNLNSKHPILSNFVMVNEGSYKIVRA
jgi:hypothetical protein